MVTSRGICYDFDAIETIVHMQVFGNPNFLANFASNRSVAALNDCVANFSFFLATNALNLWRKNEVFETSLFPGREPSALSVVVATCQETLGSNEFNLLIQAKYSAIVQGVLVEDRHANIAKDVLGQRRVCENVV